MKKSVKKIPLGVKILSILSYILVALLIVLIFQILFSGVFKSDSAFGIIFSFWLLVYSIPFSVLFFFIGRGLWKAQKWTRIALIIILGLCSLGAIFYMFQSGIQESYIFRVRLIGGINLIVYLSIGAYVLFNRKIKEFFI